jgi:ribonuclease HI
MSIQAYIDGACSGNPGPGGWGVLLLTPTGEQVLSGYQPDTTNNRMELTAAIRLLQYLSPDVAVTIFADSQYVVKGSTEWLAGWKRNGWRNAQKKTIENLDLWQELDGLIAQRGKDTLTWQWVRGHNGHPQNEKVDQIAVAAMRSRKPDPGANPSPVATEVPSASAPANGEGRTEYEQSVVNYALAAVLPPVAPVIAYRRTDLSGDGAVFDLEIGETPLAIAVVDGPDGHTLEVRIHPSRVAALSAATALFDALGVPDFVSADFVELTLLRKGAIDRTRS